LEKKAGLVSSGGIVHRKILGKPGRADEEVLRLSPRRVVFKRRFSRGEKTQLLRRGEPRVRALSGKREA